LQPSDVLVKPHCTLTPKEGLGVPVEDIFAFLSESRQQGIFLLNFKLAKMQTQRYFQAHLLSGITWPVAAKDGDGGAGSKRGALCNQYTIPESMFGGFGTGAKPKIKKQKTAAV
jgi:hypothetical protein